MKLTDFKDEKGIILRGKIGFILIIIFGIGTLIGYFIGKYSGDWYFSYLFGSLFFINLIINLPILFINMIKRTVNRRKTK